MKVSCITSRIDLDDAIDLGIEPFNIPNISREEVCYGYDTSLSFVGSEFSNMESISVSKLDKFSDHRLDTSIFVSSYLNERKSF